MEFRIFLICILFSTLPIATSFAEQAKSGSYAKASTTQKEVVDAAAFAMKAHGQALQAVNGGHATKLHLVKILSAEKQVVAGINYRLQLKIKVDGKEKQAQAVVWWQAWRKPDPYKLTSWK